MHTYMIFVYIRVPRYISSSFSAFEENIVRTVKLFHVYRL